ncbi:hypothetical protein ACNRDG_24660 [Ralstonia pseudosolanacearum]|uniref:hypothetical protein n=1 Tax=Ralstonia pseudosolanacearum TaxID=1310165 RepID=UPI002002D582|nr:hypothetical protein [Ralstonia pseudosolanacearum]MCK4130375.1 hypothetical protein [Ralstonia pseudosolanacearum]
MESLISVILTAIVGVGMAFTLSRAAVGQATLGAQNQAVTQLRSQLQTQGMNAICANAATSSSKGSAQGNSDKASNDSSNTATVVIGGTAAAATLKCTFQQLTVSVGATAKSVLVPVLAYEVSDKRMGGNSLLFQNAGQ